MSALTKHDVREAVEEVLRSSGQLGIIADRCAGETIFHLKEKCSNHDIFSIDERRCMEEECTECWLDKLTDFVVAVMNGFVGIEVTEEVPHSD